MLHVLEASGGPLGAETERTHIIHIRLSKETYGFSLVVVTIAVEEDSMY